MMICTSCKTKEAAHYRTVCNTCKSKKNYSLLAIRASKDKRFGICRICKAPLIRNGLIYCSQRCKGFAKRNTVFYKCFNCSKECAKAKGQIIRYKKWFCSFNCHIEYRRNNPNITKGTDGYIHIKRTRLHRHLIEKKLKRKLLKTEVVHHKNGNKTDNRLENLKIMTQSEHIKLHIHNHR